jgi:hypothetical protein
MVGLAGRGVRLALLGAGSIPCLAVFEAKIWAIARYRTTQNFLGICHANQDIRKTLLTVLSG